MCCNLKRRPSLAWYMKSSIPVICCTAVGIRSKTSKMQTRAFSFYYTNPFKTYWQAWHSRLYFSIGEDIEFTAVTYTDTGMVYVGTISGHVTLWDPRSTTCLLHWSAHPHEIDTLTYHKSSLISGEWSTTSHHSYLVSEVPQVITHIWWVKYHKSSLISGEWRTTIHIWWV